jgi:hypothetical protein
MTVPPRRVTILLGHRSRGEVSANWSVRKTNAKNAKDAKIAKKTNLKGLFLAFLVSLALLAVVLGILLDDPAFVL